MNLFYDALNIFQHFTFGHIVNNEGDSIILK